MKQINVIIITIMFLIAGLLAGNIAISQENSPQIITSGQYGKGYRYNIQGWVYLHIEGEPYERGYQYGYLASTEIIDTINRWDTWGKTQKIVNQLSNKHPETRWNFCRAKAMKNFLKHVPEEYQQEMKGMTDGIKARGGKIFDRDIEFEDIVASQFVQDVYYSSYKYPHKRFHPIRGIIKGIKDLLSGDMTVTYQGRCNAFIATGDATKNGDIVVSQATIFNRYIAERCNFIVDVEPSKGYRFTMTSPPGSLWSQEDWYQNEKGITITETELTPQGPFTIRKTPKGVRSRIAIQYSSSIDEVIKNLKNGNNGLIPNEWLIGDTKTGEIASFQQTFFNTPIKRTTNGYYWSCNIPHDIKVLGELTGVPPLLLKLVSKIFPKKIPFEIDGNNVIWKTDVAIKLMELGDQYYGDIDEDIAKEIMSTHPITVHTTDCKITSTNLMEKTGLIAFMGISNGTVWVPSKEDKEKFPDVTELPPSGWVEVYPSDIKSDNEQKTNIYNTDNGNSRLLKVYDEESVKDIFDSSTKNNDSLFYGSWDGNLYALNNNNGKVKWKYQTQWGIVSTPVVSEGLVLVGSLDNNFYAINNDTGEMEWSYTCNAAIHSSPAVYGDLVFFGCDDGRLYALNKTDGKFAWSFTPEYSIKNNANNYMTTPITCDPIVKDGVVYIEVNEKIYALDAQTEEKPVEVDKKKSKGYTIFIIFALLGVILLIISAIIHNIYNKKQEEINDE